MRLAAVVENALLRPPIPRRWLRWPARNRPRRTNKYDCGDFESAALPAPGLESLATGIFPSHC